MDNKQLIQDFILESRDNLTSIEPDLLELEKSLDNPSQDLINEIFRGIHSIKGSSGFFDFDKINRLSHIMENLLMKIRDGKMKPTSELIDALFAGIDKLRLMIDDVDNCDSYEIEEEINLLKKHLASEEDKKETQQKENESENPGSKAVSNDIVPTKEEFEKGSNTGQKIFAVEIDFDDKEIVKDHDIAFYIEEASSIGEILKSNIDLENIDEENLDGNLRFSCKSILEYELFFIALDLPESSVRQLTVDDITEEPEKIEEKPEHTPLIEQNELDDILAQIPGLVDDEVICIDNTKQDKRIWGQKSDGEKKPDVKQEENKSFEENAKSQETAARQEEKKSPANKIMSHSETQETIRVNVNLLDNLMNLVGELVLGRNQLLQILSNRINEFKGLNGVLQNINLITSELQESIMQTRMQPVSRVFDKFPRILRDLSHKLGKEIDLKIYGKEVELDRSIIEALSDPLTHLIRNTADHGIESATERVDNGKPAVGKVILRAYHEAGLVNIEIIDDGKGLDSQAILEKAVEKHIISAEEAQGMSEKALQNLIFAPGFSTATEVTDVSGRGVGMDVVKTNIEKLGGTVDLESTPGKGTRVNLRLPLTLAIISAMIVESGEERFAIPQVNIEQVLRLREIDMEKHIGIVNESRVLRYRDQILPLVDLADALDIPEDNRLNRKTKTVMVLRALNNKFGLFVDKVLDSEETVVKPMSKYIKANDCYAGSTIMGDGEVATILDAQGIAQTAKLDFEGIEKENELKMKDRKRSHKELQSILIFRNNTSERFAIQLDMIRRIEKIDVSDIEKIGNDEYIKYNGGSLRLIRLENYLQVNRNNIDKDTLYLIIPNITQKPVGIVAGEIMDVMETAIDLDSRNIRSNGILGSSIIKNEILLLLDTYGLLEMVDPVIFGEKICFEAARSKKALLIEDTPFLRYLESFYLNEAGIKVHQVENGSAAREIIAKEKFDIVLTDIKIDDIDGFELSKIINQSELNKHIPVLGLYSSEMDTKNTQDVGYTSFEKKTNKIRLLSTVCNLLNNRSEFKEAA